MKKVLVFGTFESLEDRHHDLLRAATEHGDSIMVALSRDAGVNDDLTEEEFRRFSHVLAIDIVDDVILAHGDHIDVVRMHKPHVIIIGPHQREIADYLDEHAEALVQSGSVVVYV